MNTEQFRKLGKEMVDYICEYNDNVADRDVSHPVDPGYLKKLLPSEPPIKGDDFRDIMKDFDSKIMPGVVHWNHPYFFAYYPSSASYPSVLGEFLSSAMGLITFSWAAGPAATELETIVVDWYAKALGLPDFFISDTPNSIGGGVIQYSSSECALICLMTARDMAIKDLKETRHADTHESVFLPLLVAYASKEAHSSVEKAAKMALIQLRILETDEHGSLRGETLARAIEADKARGLTPFFVVATVGTTGSCAFDNLPELGEVCRRTRSIWLHVDGAYGGSSFLLPEMAPFRVGMHYADSFCISSNKLMLMNFDAAPMWVRDVMALKTALTVNPLYLQHGHASLGIDYRHYGIALSRRFRALKMWFVFRSYGLDGLQRSMRNRIKMAKYFEQLVRVDERFEVLNDVYLGVVCFRLVSTEEVNVELLARINRTGKFHLVPSRVAGKFAIRLSIIYEHQQLEHMDAVWKEIQKWAVSILEPDSPDAIPLRRMDRRQSDRFSFSRSVSSRTYETESSRDELTDMCCPVLVPEKEAI